MVKKELYGVNWSWERYIEEWFCDKINRGLIRGKDLKVVRRVFEMTKEFEGK